MVEHTGLSYTEAWNFPVEFRQWWIKRKLKENKDSQGQPPSHVDPFGRTHSKK